MEMRVIERGVQVEAMMSQKRYSVYDPLKTTWVLMICLWRKQGLVSSPKLIVRVLKATIALFNFKVHFMAAQTAVEPVTGWFWMVAVLFMTASGTWMQVWEKSRRKCASAGRGKTVQQLRVYWEVVKRVGTTGKTCRLPCEAIDSPTSARSNSPFVISNSNLYLTVIASTLYINPQSSQLKTPLKSPIDQQKMQYKYLPPNNLIKSNKNIMKRQSSRDLKKLQPKFMQLVTQDVGQAKFQQEQFEEVQQPGDIDQQDFGFEEEYGTGNIDSQPFRKSIILGPQDRTEPDPDTPTLAIKKYLFLLGHNPSRHSCINIHSQVCQAAGVNIFFNDMIYLGHTYDITYLHFDPQRNILLSGTQGKCAQIKLWQVADQNGRKALKPCGKKKYNLPLNSLGVGFAWLNSDDMLVVATRYNLHRSSQIFLFDVKTGKRSHCFCKLGKIVEINQYHPQNQDQKTIVLTQKQLSILQIQGSNQYTITPLHQQPQLSTFAHLQESKGSYLIGSLKGSIKLLQEDTINFQQISSHERQVLCIKPTSHSCFISGGGDNKIVVHRINPSQKCIQKVSVVDVPSMCLNICHHNSVVHLSLKNTSVLTFKMQQYDLKPQTNKKNDKFVFNKNPSETTSQIVFDKQQQKYYYGINNTCDICFFKFQEGKLAQMDKLTLKHPPSLFDARGTLITYIHKSYNFSTKGMFKSAIKGLLMFAMKEKKVNIQTLYLFDTQNQQVTGQLEIPQNQTCTAIKINKDQLALGFFSGGIHLYNISEPQNIILLKKCQLHSSPITDLIWSQQGHIIKSISRDNLLYLDTLKNSQNLNPVFASKMLEGVQWTNCGKFDWKTFQIFNNRSHSIDEVSDIAQSYDYLLAVLQTGSLRIFKNPAGKQHQQLGKLFTHRYFCKVVFDDDDRLVLLVSANGIVYAVEVGEPLSGQSQCQSGEELSKQEES